jgi:basic membrane lipoprotein Med (substrate-binding protein (PBP1-ABC) superfamily)
MIRSPSHHKEAIRSVRRTITSGTVALMAGLAIACGGAGDRTRDAGDGEAFRVALLTPGPISDKSWNGGAYEGLLAIRDSLGAKISHIQTKTPAEFEENFRQYGAQGYDLVIGHGFEFQDAAVRVAPDYPKTIYVVTSGRVTAPNVAGISFAFEEASYQAGMIAGALSKSGLVGLIAGTELPPVRMSFTAFERGAKAVNPRVQALVSYIGNWEDVSAGKEQALAQIRRGADVLFQNADAAGLGVFQAAREQGVLAFGSNADQNAVAPDVIVGSVVIDLPKAMLMIGREVREGRFQGRVIGMGVRDDVVRLVLNPALAERIPPAARAAADSVGDLLRAGSFHALDDVLHGADSARPITPPAR